MSLGMHDIRFLPQSPSQPSISYEVQPVTPDNHDPEKPDHPLSGQVNTIVKASKFPPGTIDLVKSLLLPATAIAYLAFCYTVHYRVVPVTASGFIDTSPAHISAIKSGLTSVSILIITLGLWPLADLIGKIKSEEFFRTLYLHDSGVPLAAVNRISVPSFGMVDTVLAILRRQTSPYLTLGFIGGLLSIVTSTLAPSALSVDTVLFDTDLMAFKIGAVLQDSVYNLTDIAPFKSSAFTKNNELAASIAWAETYLGVRYSFTQRAPEGGVSPYIIPWPVDLELGTNARWLTDVVALHPTCVWSNTNVSGALDYRPDNITTISNQTRAVFLSDAGVDAQIFSFISTEVTSLQMLEADIRLSNHTTQAPLSDGSIGWQLGQCLSGCSTSAPLTAVLKYNLTGIPTLQVIGADQTWEVAFLVCSPHPTIETREVRSDNQGILTVFQDDKTHTKQENLKSAQTALMLSFAMSEFKSKAGPDFLSFGSKALLFGYDQISNVNTSLEFQGVYTLTPLQQNAIADSYVRVLQSITKVYMSGTFGTTYVPGRLSRPAVVFRSSIGALGASTALFSLLTLLLLVANFRSGQGEQFTLSSIAAALNKSDIPSQFAQIKQDAGLTKVSGKGDMGHSEYWMQGHGNTVVIFDKNSGGTLRLHTQ